MPVLYYSSIKSLINPCHVEFIWRNINMSSTFSIISRHWNGPGCWCPTLWKKGPNYPIYSIQCCWCHGDIQISTTYGLTFEEPWHLTMAHWSYTKYFIRLLTPNTLYITCLTLLWGLRSSCTNCSEVLDILSDLLCHISLLWGIRSSCTICSEVLDILSDQLCHISGCQSHHLLM